MGFPFAHFTPVHKISYTTAFAPMLRDISRAYPCASTIHLVMDNLSTHKKNSLTEAFGLAEGERLWSRFTVHYTPKHGSWLDVAEIAISLYSRQCLGKRRIASIDELRKETNAWRRSANRKRLKIDWNFTVQDARRRFRYSRTRRKIILSEN